MSQYDATHITTLSIRWQREPSNTSAMPSWSHTASYQSLPSKIHAGKYGLQLNTSVSSFSTVSVFCSLLYGAAFVTLWITMWREIEQYTLLGEVIMEILHISHIDELWLWDRDSKLRRCILFSIKSIRSGITGTVLKSEPANPHPANWLCAIITKWVCCFHTTVTESEYLYSPTAVERGEGHTHTLIQKCHRPSVRKCQNNTLYTY